MGGAEWTQGRTGSILLLTPPIPLDDFSHPCIPSTLPSSPHPGHTPGVSYAGMAAPRYLAPGLPCSNHSLRSRRAQEGAGCAESYRKG